MRKSPKQSVERLVSQMSEATAPVDGSDATIVTEFAYNETNSKKIIEVRNQTEVSPQLRLVKESLRRQNLVKLELLPL